MLKDLASGREIWQVVALKTVDAEPSPTVWDQRQILRDGPRKFEMRAFQNHYEKSEPFLQMPNGRNTEATISGVLTGEIPHKQHIPTTIAGPMQRWYHIRNIRDFAYEIQEIQNSRLTLHFRPGLTALTNAPKNPDGSIPTGAPMETALARLKAWFLARKQLLQGSTSAGQPW